MTTYDFKKQQKEYYTTNTNPHYIEIPKMNFIMVKGVGNPNEENGEYQKAIGLLYALSYAIKMSYKTDYKIPGFYDYVVAPLEGLWTLQDDSKEFDKNNKQNLAWTAMIHQPDFVSDEVFAWACEQVQKKKKLDTACAFLQSYEEGLCIQMMHQGSYDSEVISFAKMEKQLIKDHYTTDVHLNHHHHHEIYLKDNRDPDETKWKTILRQKIKK